MEVFLNEKIEGKKVELLIDTNIFNKYIILKTAHNFLDIGYFFFKLNEDKNIIMQFTLKEGIKEKAEKVVLDFSDELLNNVLREKVFEENKEVRTEIITSAIQNSLKEASGPSNWQGYEDVSGNETGPINGDDAEIDFDKDIDEILKEIENDPELKIDEEEIEKILKEIEEESDTENETGLEDEKKETGLEDEKKETDNISLDLEGVKKSKEDFKKS